MEGAKSDLSSTRVWNHLCARPGSSLRGSSLAPVWILVNPLPQHSESMDGGFVYPWLCHTPTLVHLLRAEQRLLKTSGSGYQVDVSQAKSQWEWGI